MALRFEAVTALANHPGLQDACLKPGFGHGNCTHAVQLGQSWRFGTRAKLPAVSVPRRPARHDLAALCVSGRSIYQHLPGVDAYDRRRDARTFPGGLPVVGHPPCRTWSKFLRHQARPADWQGEQDLGRFVVRMVIENGGVLEHPAGSLLFADQNLPVPNSPEYDAFLYAVYIEQAWFGYASVKPTWVLVAGLPRHLLPPIPMKMLAPDANQGTARALGNTARSRTVGTFADWLCQTARATWWQFR